MPTLTPETAAHTFDTLVNDRRAVKHYDPTHPIPQADLETLTRWAMHSPTSFNIQHWRFVWVTDKAIQQQLQAAAWNQAHVGEASAVLVLCADLNAWNKQPERYWRNAPKAIQDMLVPMIQPFYDGKPELARDEAIRSCGIAAQTIMLGAKALGYDTCPMIGFDPDAIGSIINLPDHHIITMMIPIGKATEPAKPRGGSIDINEAVFNNSF